MRFEEGSNLSSVNSIDQSNSQNFWNNTNVKFVNVEVKNPKFLSLLKIHKQLYVTEHTCCNKYHLYRLQYFFSKNVDFCSLCINLFLWYLCFQILRQYSCFFVSVLWNKKICFAWYIILFVSSSIFFDICVPRLVRWNNDLLT